MIATEEQISLFNNEIENETIQEKILRTARNVLLKHDISEKAILLIQGKDKNDTPINTYSLRLLSMFLGRIDFTRKVLIHFEIKDIIFKNLCIPSEACVRKIASKEDFTFVDFSEETQGIYNLINQIVIYAINNFNPEEHFGCCGNIYYALMQKNVYIMIYFIQNLVYIVIILNKVKSFMAKIEMYDDIGVTFYESKGRKI